MGAGWTLQGFTAQGRWLRAGSGPRPASTGGPCHALARATSTCPGALHPPCPSPPTSCLAPRWLSGPPSSSLVDARGPLPFSGRSLGSRYLQGPRGQKGASRRRPPLASGVGLGLGSRPRPGPPARGGGGGRLSIRPGSSLALGGPGLLHCALRGGRPPWGLRCPPQGRGAVCPPPRTSSRASVLLVAHQLFLDVLPGSFLRSRGRERLPLATGVGVPAFPPHLLPALRPQQGPGGSSCPQEGPRWAPSPCAVGRREPAETRFLPLHRPPRRTRPGSLVPRVAQCL